LSDHFSHFKDDQFTKTGSGHQKIIEKTTQKRAPPSVYLSKSIRCMQAAKSLTVAMEAEGTLGEIGADTTLAGAPPRGNTP